MVAHHHARLASGRWSGSTGRDWLPAGFHLKGFKLPTILLSRAFLARGQTDLEFSPLRPRARSSALRSRLAFDSLWSRAANRADRLGTLSGRERPRIGTSSARVASVWCFAR